MPAADVGSQGRAQAAAVGSAVFVPETAAAFVAPERLNSRGCDASNVYDEELPDHLQEHSDDEAQSSSKKRAANFHGDQAQEDY